MYLLLTEICSVFRVLSWYFLAQSLLNWARAAEWEAGGGRSQTRRSQGAERQRGVSRAVIHHYLTVDTDNPPTANQGPAFSPASQSEARSLWWSGVTLSGLTTGPWWMIGRWSMVCCKLGCIIPHQFTRHQAGEGRHSNSLENSRRLNLSKSSYHKLFFVIPLSAPLFLHVCPHIGTGPCMYCRNDFIGIKS